MGKDPAFLFYPNDWLGGTMTLDRVHKGAYMDLLCLQFNQGPLSENDIRDLLNGDYEKCWPKLSRKFVEKNGFFFNERLEEERLKRQKYSESRRANRLKSRIKPKKHMSKICKTYVKHMEDENEDENRNINEVVSYLNKILDTKYKVTTKTTRSLILARMKDGFSVDDFKMVIDNKFDDWYKDDKMSKYLTPDTLFGNKFEKYLNQNNSKYDRDREFRELINEA